MSRFRELSINSRIYMHDFVYVNVVPCNDGDWKPTNGYGLTFGGEDTCVSSRRIRSHGGNMPWGLSPPRPRLWPRPKSGLSSTHTTPRFGAWFSSAGCTAPRGLPFSRWPAEQATLRALRRTWSWRPNGPPGPLLAGRRRSGTPT